MAVTVDLVRNVLTSKYLTYAGNNISVHGVKNHSDNFHLYNNGPLRHLQVFSNSNKKFTHAPAAGQCSQSFTTGSTGSMIHTSSNSSLHVKLYVEDSSGNKYYLRINTAQGNAVELVCQSHVDNAPNPYLQQEVEFDLVKVSINDL